MLRTAGALIVASFVVVACSSDDQATPTSDGTTDPVESAAATTAPPTTAATTTVATTSTAVTTVTPTTVTPNTVTPTTAPVEPLLILVTNDDGIAAGGLAASVAALDALPDAEVVVVAPAENQSGTSDSTSDGDVTYTDAETADGTAGTAVSGTPADAVTVAVEQLGITPDLVVSGVNEGQNIGPFTDLSGTVGAARTAARLGFPSIAASAGFAPDGVEPAWQETAAFVVEFIETVRREDGSLDLPVSVTSFNTPTCGDDGHVRGLVPVVVAPAFPDGADPFATDCTSTVDAPGDDYGALSNGFATVADVGF